MQVFLTGASGFLGKSVCQALLNNHVLVSALIRPATIFQVPDSVQIVESTLEEVSNFESEYQNKITSTLKASDAVIHTAARAHVMVEQVIDPLSEYRKVNTRGTLLLARKAAECGVKRFVFISSIKVNGELTQAEQSFSPNDKFTPTDPYALSKYEAEKGLLEIAKDTGMEVVIIRPPLVYGPDVKANFASIVKLIKKGIPLPFGRVENKRSLVALDNLVSFIMLCMEHPYAANQIFLISDGEDVSTTTLLRRIANAYEKRAWLVPIPVSWMTAVAKALGKEDKAKRLFGNLQVDSSKARDLLGWKPVVTMDEQLKKMAEAEK